MRVYRRVLNFALICSLSAVVGCATARRPHGVSGPPAHPAAVAQQVRSVAPRGFYHTALPGQTLWRISRIYGIDLDELAAANKIEDATRIAAGQKIFVPERGEDRQVCVFPQGREDEDFLWPLKGTVLLDGVPEYRGLNIAPLRSAEVVASKSGRVVFSGNDFLDLGRTLIIDHNDGFLTVYGRLAQADVSNGAMVSRGSVIGLAGSTARDRRQYLHFQIRKAAKAQNPYLYLTD